jgi:hypothetical protein
MISENNFLHMTDRAKNIYLCIQGIFKYISVLVHITFITISK